MRKLVLVATIVAAVALGVLLPRGTSAPALGEKPVRYEYAELRYVRTLMGQPGIGLQLPRMVGPGALPPPPPAPAAAGLPAAQPAQVQATVRWTTAEEEVTFKEWEDMADKLRAAPPKKESPPTVHKLRVLNKLSEDGWELLDRPGGDVSAATWTFRRPMR